MEQQSQANLGQLLVAARKEAADKALEKASERLTNQTNNISKLRMEFFDRLILLDGGTISLSLTLVGLLKKTANAPGHHPSLLFFAWACFVLSLGLAMIRNWREHDRLMAAEWTSYSLVVHEHFSAFVQQVESLGVSTADSPAQTALQSGPKIVEQQQKKEQDLNRNTKRLGAAALILSLMGYLLLIWFAIANSATLL